METIENIQAELERLEESLLDGGKVSIRPIKARRIVRTLAELGDEQSLEILISLLDHRITRLVHTAAMALGRLGDVRAAGPLISLLDHSNRRVLRSAIGALGNLGDKRAVEPLIGLINVREEGSDDLVIEALGKLGDKRAVEPLISLLSHEDEKIVGSAVKTLGEFEDERSVGPLLGLLEVLGPKIWNDRLGNEVTGDDVVVLVVEALGKLGDKRAVEPLIFILDKERDGGERGDPRRARSIVKSVVETLANIGGDRATEGIEGVGYGPDHWDLRIVALEHLVTVGKDEAFEELAAMLVEGGKREKKAVAGILGNLGDDRAVGPLISAISDNDDWVAVSAVKALGDLGPDRAIEALIGVLRDESASSVVRDEVVSILESQADEGVVDALIEVLGQRDGRVVTSAIKALGNLGFERAIDPLWNVQYELERGWQENAAGWETTISVGKLGGRRAFERLVDLVKDNWKTYGKNALDIMIRLDKDRAFEPLWEIYLSEEGRLDWSDRWDRRGEILAILDENFEDAYERLVMSFYDLSELGENSNRDMARISLDAIKKIDPDRANELMVHVLEEHDLEELGSIATTHLIDFGGSGFFEPISNSLKRDWGKKFPSEVFVFLGESSDERALDSLLDCWETSGVNIHWVKAVGKIGDTRAVPPLLELLEMFSEDGVRSWQFELIKALGRIGDHTAVYPLDELMAESDQPYIRAICHVALHSIGGKCEIRYDDQWRLCNALASIGNQESVDFLANGAAEETRVPTDIATRVECIETLVEMESDLAIEGLIRVFENRYPTERESALRGIVRIGDSAIGPLIEALPGGGWKTRLCIALALGEIGSEEHVEILNGLKDDEDEDVCEAASKSIQSISGRDE